MVSIVNNFSGAPVGTTPTAANSGGISGNAFAANPTLGSGTTSAYVTDPDGGASFAFTYPTTAVSSYATINMAAANRRTVFELRFKISTLPTALEQIAVIRNSTANPVRLMISATGTLLLYDTTSPIAGAAGSAALPINQWITVKIAATPGTTTSNGIVEFAYWLDTTQVFSSGILTGRNTGTTVYVAVAIGRRSNTYTGARTVTYDDIAATDDLASGWITVPRAPIATETWTGTTGGWPAGWTILNGGTATLDTNRGRLAPPNATAYITGAAYLASAPAASEISVTVDFGLLAGNVVHYAAVGISADATTMGAYGMLGMTGYSVIVEPTNNVVTLRRAPGNGTDTILVTANPGFTAGVRSNVNLTRNGGKLTVTVWNVGTGKPAVPTITYTDAAPLAPTARPMLFAQNGASGGPHAITFDNLVVAGTAVVEAVVPSMPNQLSSVKFVTTPAGTVIYKYEVVTDTVAAGLSDAQKRAFVYVPESKLTATHTKMVFAAHGLGDHPAAGLVERNQATLDLLEGLADAGYVVISPYYESTLGNADSQLRMKRAHAYMTAKWTSIGTVLYGFSQGGGISAVAAHQNTIPDIRAINLVAPVLNWAPLATNTAESGAWYAAYNTNAAGFAAATAGFDPSRQPVSEYKGQKWRIATSSDDGYASIRTSAISFLASLSNEAVRAIEVEVFGNHGSIGQFVGPEDIVAFYEEATSYKPGQFLGFF